MFHVIYLGGLTAMAKELGVTLFFAFVIVGFVPDAFGFMDKIGLSLAYYAALLVVSIILIKKASKQSGGSSNT
jgi:hypothetical protein